MSEKIAINNCPVDADIETFYKCECGLRANSKIYKLKEGCPRCGKPFVGIIRFDFSIKRECVSLVN